MNAPTPSHLMAFEPFDFKVGWCAADFEALMMHCVRQNTSDITIQTGDYVWAEIHGRHKPVTLRRMQNDDIERIVGLVYGGNGITLLNSGRDLDPSYEIKVDRHTRQRFRVNLTPGQVGSVREGVSITARTIPDLPPRIETLGLPDEIVQNAFPMSGIVLVIGPTGSGKTTLLGSVIRAVLENENDTRKILTYEAPVEFIYAGVDTKMPLPCQTEVGVGKQLESFSAAIRNALRRKPSIIQIGEARDVETMDGLLEAALTGHTTYSTVHAKTCAETIGRIVHMFPYEVQGSAATKLLGALRMLVVQKLLRTNDGKRAAIREWIVFDREVRELLWSTPVTDWPRAVQTIVDQRGTGLAVAAKVLYDAGSIDRDTYLDAAELPVGAA